MCVFHLFLGTSQVQQLMTVLISEHERLYEGTVGDVSSEQTGGCPRGQRNMAQWISEDEILNRSPSSQTSKTGEGVCASAISLDVTVGALNTAKVTPQGKSGLTVSPSKQAKSLPSWKYSFKGGGTRAQTPKIGGSSVDVSSLPSAGNWLMNGLSSLRSHRRTSSGERMGKDSPLSHRLSTYDNVTSSSLSVPSVASTPWSTSSCEILVADSVSSDPSGLSCVKAEWSVGGSVQGPGEQSSEITDSSDALEICVSSAGCSENGNAEGMVNVVGETDSRTTALKSVTTELKDELKKQKISYELRIRK